MLLGDGLFFRADFAFEALFKSKRFPPRAEGFEVAGTAAMVGEDAGDQCRIVLGQCGNKVLVDTDGQRFESFEDVVFAVDVIGNHVGLFFLAHGLDGGFQSCAQSGFLVSCRLYSSKIKPCVSLWHGNGGILV